MSDESDDSYIAQARVVVAATLAATMSLLPFKTRRRRRRSNRHGTVARYRLRRSVESVYHAVGDRKFRAGHRMSYADFQQLCLLLDPHLNELTSRGNGPLRRGGANGRIANSVRVACALQFFAGGKGYDLVPLYGISRALFFESILMVVEAINYVLHWQ